MIYKEPFPDTLLTGVWNIKYYLTLQQGNNHIIDWVYVDHSNLKSPDARVGLSEIKCDFMQHLLSWATKSAILHTYFILVCLALSTCLCLWPVIYIDIEYGFVRLAVDSMAYAP